VKQFEGQLPRKQLCQWLALPRSVSYYQPQTGKPGARPSQNTLRLDGTNVPNEQVMERIRQLLQGEFNAFGYEYTTARRPGQELKKEYVINKKKVYRLMNEQHLSTRTKRNIK